MLIWETGTVKEDLFFIYSGAVFHSFNNT